MENERLKTTIKTKTRLRYFDNIPIQDEERKKDEDSGPEDEEVPTRGYLKRQSNLILDAKSRSKKGGKRR